MNKRIKAYFYLLTTAVIWGFASPIIKYTLRYIPPFAFLFWRFLITAIISLPLFLFYKRQKKIKLNYKKIAWLGALGFLGTTLGLSLFFIGLKFTTAIDGSLIYSISPVLVIIGGAWLLNEKVTNLEKTGAVLAFLGSIITIIQPILEGKVLALENIGGNILILLSAFSWAVYCLIVRKLEFKEKADPLILTTIGFFAGLITIIPFYLIEKSFFFPSPHFWPVNSAWPGIIYIATFSSIIAYLTYNLGYSLIEASEATIFDYLKPLFAAPLAILWLGEQITLPFLLGAFFIFLGVFLTEYRPKAKTKEP